MNCWDDVVLEQDCPEGLLFSTKGYCDYPINVNCGDRSSIQEGRKIVVFESVYFKTKYVSDDSVPSDCPVDRGTFRNKTKCNSFYTCISYKVVATYECPEGFNFNDVRKI